MPDLAAEITEYLAGERQATEPNELRSRIFNYEMTFDQAISFLPHQKRSSKIITVGGVTLPFRDMARAMGIDPRTVRSRIRKGWGVEDAFTKPVQNTKEPVAC